MKLDNWEIALETIVTGRMETPFEYGTHDCCLFAADCVLAISGVDIAEAYRGKYTDAVSAFALIQTVTGGTTVEDTMDHACKTHEFIRPLDSILYAQRGDVVSMIVGDTITLGVVALDGSHAWFTGESLTKYPLSKCARAWNIR